MAQRYSAFSGKSPSVSSKIRGCVLGAALGDAIGGPFEFQPVGTAAAFRAGSFDIGYAREAVALLAAALSLAVASKVTPRSLLERVIMLDPLHSRALRRDFTAFIDPDNV